MSVVDQKSFRQILFRSIILPIAVGIATCAAFVIVVNLLIDESKRVALVNQRVANVNETLKLMIDAETGARGYLLSRDEGYLQPYLKAQDLIPEQLSDLKKSLNYEIDQVYRVDEINKLYHSWQIFAQESVDKAKDSKHRQTSLGEGRSKPIMDQIRTLFARIITFEENRSAQLSKNLNDLTQTVLIIVVLIAIITSIFSAYFGRGQILNLSQSYESLLKASNEKNEILQNQQWLKTGQSDLGDLMAQDHTIGSLGDIIATFVAKYVNAQVGAFYVTNNLGDAVERVGAYSFAEPQKNKSIQFGQGIVGQAARDKKVTVVKGIKTDHLKVTTGLGESDPAEILVAPFVSDNKVIALLELGFVGSSNSRVIDFYEQIIDGVTTAVEVAQYRDQREKFLKEIQNQAEELQTQQEELRVSNEELEEQARMLKETQARLEAQHAEMEQTNTQLEEQTQTLENQRDLLDKRNEVLVDTKMALEQKAVELQRASQFKSEFLANMSHELRTPLNSSLILAKIMAENKDQNLTPQQVEFCKQIESSGQDLLNLINDILDLSKVESGKLDIVVEKIDLKDVGYNIERIFKPLAESKSLKLTVYVDPAIPYEFISDRVRVDQILKNLVSNSVKFTEKGEVNIKIFLNSKHNVCFEVRDTGIGIRDEHQRMIFEAFRQADGTTSRKFGGTGLGLSISKNLSQILGGDIYLHSVYGSGSTFTLELPMNYTAQKAIEVPALAPVTKLKDSQINKNETKNTQPFVREESEKVKTFFADDRNEIVPKDRVALIVEDDPKFARVVFDLAHELHYKCLVTDSAEEALRLAELHNLHAVILDISLPDQNGLYVLDQLKHRQKTRHVPVQVISASDFSRQALHLGAAGYQLKPVKREEMVQAFAKLETKFKQGLRRVLIVEDNDIQRGAIEKLIQDKNLETVAVGTGEKALEILKDEDFDCVIVDVNLPDMTGFDLLEKLNSQRQRPYPPVIVYTGRDLSRDEELRLSRYSRSVIIKGAKSPERLLDEVTLFLHKVESALDADKQNMLQGLRNRDKVFDNKTILVVDDDMRNSFALTAALEQKGAKVIIAKNGKESLEKLKAQPEEIDMVLMDIMMPVMDGFLATREIRRIPEFKRLPIIALTAKATKDDHKMCIDAGANDYLAKPVDLDKLISLARIWLNAGWR